MLHVRFEGKSYDLSMDRLGLHLAMSDHQIKQRVAQHLDVGHKRLRGYVVDRPRAGQVIVRPEAVYG